MGIQPQTPGMMPPPPPPVPVGGGGGSLPLPTPTPLPPPPQPHLRSATDDESHELHSPVIPLVVPQNAEHMSRVPSVPMLFDNESKKGETNNEQSQSTVGPTILLESLHVLDPLCIKWNIGIDATGAPASKPPTPPSSPAANSRPVFLSSPSPRTPSSSKQAAGYMRLMGLLSNGRPWECSLSMLDIGKPGGVVIGRDSECCHVVLPEGSISRRHALVERVGRSIVVSDMNSTNGVAVNGQQLARGEQRVALMDGTILTLGDVTLRIEIVESAVSDDRT